MVTDKQIIQAVKDLSNGKEINNEDVRGKIKSVMEILKVKTEAHLVATFLRSNIIK